MRWLKENGRRPVLLSLGYEPNEGLDHGERDAAPQPEES